jgi:hypothetical protein
VCRADLENSARLVMLDDAHQLRRFGGDLREPKSSCGSERTGTTW